VISYLVEKCVGLCDCHAAFKFPDVCMCAEIREYMDVPGRRIILADSRLAAL
jgi:hypothetical protein